MEQINWVKQLWRRDKPRKSMTKKIIYGCEARGDQDKPYLIRYTIIDVHIFAIYFHIFVRSDADELHDHPWNFWSIILWRGYIEETFTSLPKIGPYHQTYNTGIKTKKRRILPLSILYRPAHHAHRVELIDGKRAYSLVFRSKYVRQWGFFTPTKWQIWNQYFTEKGC